MLENGLDDWGPATEKKMIEGHSGTNNRRRTERERRLSKKSAKKNKVQFKYEIKLAKMEKQGTGFGNWISSFFTKEDNPVKALAQVEHVPEQKGNPRNEYHTTVQAG